MKSAALRRFYEATGFTVMRAAVLINIAALLGIIGLIVVNAWPAMTWEFLTEPPRDLMTKGGILPCIIGTFCLALGALVIALPLGVASAVYLKEYSQPSVWVTLTRLSIANLAGVPSIVFGLFGLTFFVVFCGFGVSLLSGILTLAVLSLPIIINTTEAALSQIPQDWREASLALGASQRETTLKVVLPNAHSDRFDSCACPRRRRNGRDHVHRQRFLYAKGRCFAVRPGNGAALPHLCAGDFRHQHRSDAAAAVRHRTGALDSRAPHELGCHCHPRTPSPLMRTILQ